MSSDNNMNDNGALLNGVPSVGQSAPKETRAPDRGRGFLALFDTGAFVGTFSLLIILLAGAGFIYKLVEFGRSLKDETAMAFAIMPVTTYLIVASGFMCLFVWAFLSGKFADLEAAKYDLLETEERYQRAEAAEAAAAKAAEAAAKG